MSPVVEKIFMLQRHQLIRWGPPQGYFLVVLGLLFMLSAIALQIQAVKARSDLAAMIADGTQLRLVRLARLKTEDELRAFATLSVKEHDRTQMDYQEFSWKSIRSLSFITLGGGIILLATGLLAFRASELASQVEEESRKAGILSGRSGC